MHDELPAFQLACSSSILHGYEQWFVTKLKMHAYLSFFCSITLETSIEEEDGIKG